jgi:acyl-CoA dehydrogenase
MDMQFTDEQRAIEDGVGKVVDRFDDDYWSACESEPRFPHEFYRAMADAGFLGIAMPVELGGAGLGVTEAAIMMHRVTQSGGGYSAASSIHLNIFGPHAIVVHGTADQKARWLKPLIEGRQKACFGVTEPNAGLDTTSIETFARRSNDGYVIRGRKLWTTSAQVADKILLLARTTPKAECKKPTDGMTLFYTDLDRAKVEVRRIPKMGRNAVDSNAVFIDDLAVPDFDRVGEEGKGFRYLLDSLNPERILIAAEAVGLGRDALKRAANYARERKVFGRPIGQNQGVQHPLAESWAYLESAWWMTVRAAQLYDAKKPCGAEANAAKFLGARAAFDAATRAVMTHGGMGYATEYQVERLFRESMLPRIAPVTEQLILSFIAENVLHLPKSY